MEQIKSGFRVLSRIIKFAVLVCRYLTRAYFIYFLPGDPKEKRRRLLKNSSEKTELICKAFDIKVTVTNPIDPNQVGLIVGNHMGFVDILAANSIAPALFVTSQEMRRTPFLGTLCECAPCIFVDRKNRSNILMELKDLIHSLKEGFRIIIYPEATSHNGEEILPFKRTLISAAAHAKVPIIPYCFNYRKVGGEEFSLRNRDSVCWYGDQSFIGAGIRLFKLSSVEVEIEFLPFVYANPDDDRAKIADLVRERINQKFKPVIERRT